MNRFWKMAGISLAIALVFTGCDDLLKNEQNGSETPAYSIALDGVDGETYAFKSADTELALLVVNSGDEATGTLTAELTGDGSKAFTLSKTELPSIAAGKSGKLVVKVVAELEAGVYKAAVVLSGEKGVAASLDVSYEVEEEAAAANVLVLDAEDIYEFPSAAVGYGTQKAKTVAITNTGDVAVKGLRFELEGSDDEAFKLSATELKSLAAGKSSKLTVTPKTGLSAGIYTATVRVSGEGIEPVSFEVRFNVLNDEGEPPDEPEAVEETDTDEEAAAEEPEAVEETDTEEEAVDEEPVEPSYGIDLSETGTYAFSLAIDGYSEQTPKLVTISNTGNQPTGALTVTLSGGDASAFALAPASIANIEAGGTATFAVAPKTALPIGVHTATVTVTGDNGISESFYVSLTVNPAPFYGIGLDVSGTHRFPEAIFGYDGAQTPKWFTVTNTGNQPTGTLTVVADGDFEVTIPANGAVASIPKDGTAAFAVAPKTGLSVGTHTATVTVTGANGISESFGVSFAVTATYGISLSVRGTHHFPEAIFGYPAQDAKTVTISNTENQPTGTLTLALTGTGASAFTLNPTSTVASIQVSGTAAFTVAPKTGLSVGTHTATVTVTGANGISESFGVSFVVTATYGITL